MEKKGQTFLELYEQGSVHEKAAFEQPADPCICHDQMLVRYSTTSSRSIKAALCVSVCVCVCCLHPSTF